MKKPNAHLTNKRRREAAYAQGFEAGRAASAAPSGEERYRHLKRGSVYTVITRGRLQVDGDLDNETVVIYRGEDGQTWVRPEYEFNDGRFELLSTRSNGPLNVAVQSDAADSEVDRCPICAEPFKADDNCATDIELGACHFDCLDGSPVADLETGEELPDEDLHSFPYSEIADATPTFDDRVEITAKAIWELRNRRGGGSLTWEGVIAAREEFPNTYDTACDAREEARAVLNALLQASPEGVDDGR